MANQSNWGSCLSLAMTNKTPGRGTTGSYHSVSMPHTVNTTPPNCFKRLKYWVFGERESPDLINATLDGRYVDCEAILEKGLIDIDTQHETTGQTALHYAVKNGKVEFVNLLLQYDANCNIQDNDGNTPLHLAILKGQRNCCKTILECDKLNINLKNNEHETPLHIAAKKRDNKTIDTLLNMKPDFSQVDTLGNTILHIAAEGGLLDLCDKFLQRDMSKINKKNNENNTSLHLAAKAGNLEVIRMLRNRQAECNVQNSSGDTPLHLAVSGGHFACFMEMLEFINLEIDLSNNNHSTALHSAVKSGDSDMVEQLLRRHANCNARDSVGNTPLHLAIIKGHYTCCEKLLKCNNLEINEKNKAHESPLHTAARTHGRKNECHLILQHPKVNIDIVKNKVHQSPLHLAAQENNSEVVELLLQKGANWKMRDKFSYMAIHYAAENGSEKSCEFLMKMVKNFNVQMALKLRDKKTPLMLAARGGHHRCCEILPVHDINDQDDCGNTALFYATNGDYLRTVSFLLTRKADTTIENLEGRTVLHEAAKNKADTCLLHLLQNQNNEELLHVKDKTNNYTPLHEAIINEALACAEILLHHGASVQDRAKHGMTTLHLAAKEGDAGICSLLMSYDIDVNVENDCQETPLHVAAKYGSRDACKILMRKGTRLQARNKDGRTALHLAADRGHDQVVTLLIRRGLSPHIKDDENSTALHLAAANGHLKCCDILAANAKRIITDVDKENKLAIDRAFENKHDEVFAFLIKYLKPKKEITVQLSYQIPKHKNVLENEERRQRFHKYMHQSLRPENTAKPRMIAAEAIIESEWWTAGFFTDTTTTTTTTTTANKKPKTPYCSNFRELVNHHPSLALKAQDRCCEHMKTKPDKKKDFRLFEDHFCPESEPLKPGLTYGQRLLRYHPVSLMVQHTRADLLQHQLTDNWLMHLWETYISYMLIFLLLTQVMYLVAINVFMQNVDNWTHIQYKCNTTQEEFCRLSSTPVKAVASLNTPEALEEREVFSVMVTTTNTTNTTTITTTTNTCYEQSSLLQLLSRIFLFIMIWFILIPEAISCARLWTEYFTPKRLLRITQLVLTIIPLLPIGICGLQHHVMHTWQWHCGIVALLLEWILFFDKLNQLPVFFIFMPVTNFFLWNYMKALGFILLLLFAFSYVFHLLLADQAAFSTMSQSMLKMMVWLLGDLNYDDTFVESPLVYPHMAKLMFVGFIIIMGGFIANLATGQPSDRLDSFRKSAAFSQKATQTTLFLEIKACFPRLEKLATKIFEGKQFRLNAIFGKMAHKIFTPTIIDETDCKEDGTTLQELEEKVDTLVDLCKEQREELRDLKLQLNNLFRRIPQINQASNPNLRKISQLTQ